MRIYESMENGREMKEEVVVWGPATIANWGPGFDLMGAAVAERGDRVRARINHEHPGEIRIVSITGDGGKLPTDPQKNTAGIAASEALAILGRSDLGVDLWLEKGLPLGSGMGSSGASAAAAAYAVSALCGHPLPKEALLPALLKAESAVSGWHADNVAPALLGGFVLVYSYEPLSIQCLPTPDSIALTLITPAISIQTREARQVVPQHVPLKQHIQNSGQLAAFISALYTNDSELLGNSIQDVIIEPARSTLLPHFLEVKQAALDAGAFGCSISGSGPTIFALSGDTSTAQRVAKCMQQTFAQHDLDSQVFVTTIDTQGTREESTKTTVS